MDTNCKAFAFAYPENVVQIHLLTQKSVNSPNAHLVVLLYFQNFV